MNAQCPRCGSSMFKPLIAGDGDIPNCCDFCAKYSNADRLDGMPGNCETSNLVERHPKRKSKRASVIRGTDRTTNGTIGQP